MIIFGLGSVNETLMIKLNTVRCLYDFKVEFHELLSQPPSTYTLIM